MAWKNDEIDRKILEILRDNAQIPNEALGKKVGLSEPAARRRVHNLVSQGVIRRFTIDVEECGGVQAIVFLATSPHVASDKIVKLLSNEPGVGSVWEISGDLDVALLLSAPDMDNLNKRVDKIRGMDAIKKTKTTVIMKKWR